jgi:hypothetical protein
MSAHYICFGFVSGPWFCVGVTGMSAQQRDEVMAAANTLAKATGGQVKVSTTPLIDGAVVGS